MKWGPEEQRLVIGYLVAEKDRRARLRYEEATVVAEMLDRQERN